MYQHNIIGRYTIFDNTNDFSTRSCRQKTKKLNTILIGYVM